MIPKFIIRITETRIEKDSQIKILLQITDCSSNHGFHENSKLIESLYVIVNHLPSLMPPTSEKYARLKVQFQV